MAKLSEVCCKAKKATSLWQGSARTTAHKIYIYLLLRECVSLCNHAHPCIGRQRALFLLCGIKEIAEVYKSNKAYPSLRGNALMLYSNTSPVNGECFLLGFCFGFGFYTRVQ